MKKKGFTKVLLLLLATAGIQSGYAHSGQTNVKPITQITMKEIVTLPPLNYSMTALAPVISKQTLEYHYGKHFKAYVDQLNKLVQGTEFENMTLTEIIQKSPEGALFNNAGQVLNHALYFEQFTATKMDAEILPKGKLMKAIEQNFGDFITFKKAMSDAAVKLFGSGWAWLVQTEDRKLQIEQYYNADNPVKHNQIPILCIDVWEHAYYLDYQNGRAEYVQKIWDIMDWETIGKRMK